MGIKPFVRLFLEGEMTPKSWMPHPPKLLRDPNRPKYAIEDNQHVIKTMMAKHEGARTVHLLKCEIAEHHLARMKRRGVPVSKYISCFDRGTPVVKAAVEHTHRDQGIDPWPEPTDGAPIFDESRPDDILPILEPGNWRRFCRTRHLVRRHLYPLIFNTLIDPNYVMLEPNQLIVLHGIPGQWKMVPRHDIPVWDSDGSAPMRRGPVYDAGDDGSGERMMPMLVKRGPVTEDEELADPEVYDRIWLIEGRRGPDGRPYMHYEEWKEAKNSLLEADMAIVFYDKFFPKEDCLVYGNDGDFIPILLAYARERKVADGWRNHMWLRMPNLRLSDAEVARKEREEKRKKGIELLPQELEEERIYMQKKMEYERLYPGKTYRAPNPNPELYYDINDMWTTLHEHNEWGAAGVQNAVLSMIALIIMAGNDFFKEMLPGVSTEKATNHIWTEFLENPAEYRHLFQLSKHLEPDPRALREPVIDEELFIEFCHRVYLRHYRVRRTKTERQARQKEADAAIAAGQEPPPDTILHVQASMAAKEKRRQKSITTKLKKLQKELQSLPPTTPEPKRVEIQQEIERQERRKTDPKELAANRMRSRNELRLVCRRLLAALLYNYNGPRDSQCPDWTRQVNGLPVYGYELDPDDEQRKRVMISDVVVREYPDPIPDVYQKWFLTTRRVEQFEARRARRQALEDGGGVTTDPSGPVVTPQGTSVVPSLLSPTVQDDQEQEQARKKMLRRPKTKRRLVRPRP